MGYTLEANKDLTVVHANQLVEACYSVSLQQMRLITFAATKYDSREGSQKEIRIDIDEFRNVYGLTSGTIYPELRAAAKALMRSPIIIHNESSQNTIEYSWLLSNEYRKSDDNDKHNSFITLTFNPQIEPFLFELKERFTSYKFQNSINLDTSFSFRLYQWLAQAKNLKKNRVNGTIEVVLEIEWMKSRAGYDGLYKVWSKFNERVIKPAVDKINAVTDIYVMYEPLRSGRSYSAVKFTYVEEKVKTALKPMRPRLARRPKVKADSHAEAAWMNKNLNLLLDFEMKLKNYDPSERLTINDIQKMVTYSKDTNHKEHYRLKKELELRKRK